VSTPAPASPAPYMPPALTLVGYVSETPYTLQSSPGPYTWYGVSAIGSAYTPVPDANTNTNDRRPFRPPSVPALIPSAPAAAATSVKLARPTTTSDSNNTPQVFYPTQEIEARFPRDPELATPPKPTVHNAPAQSKRGIKHAVGKQATFGLDGFITHSGGFRSSGPFE